MAKTAEDFIMEHMVKLDHTFIEEDFCNGEKDILVASHKAFAAQEVEAYKSRLKIAIDDEFMAKREEMSANWAGRKIIKLIDAVK